MKIKKKKENHFILLSPEQKSLLLLSNKTLDNLQKTELLKILSRQDFDWDQFFNFSFQHSLWPIVYNKLKNDFPFLIPLDIDLKFRLLCKHISKRNSLLLDEFKKILFLFHDNGIQTISLKGLDLCQRLYEDFFSKTVTDIDLLVPTSDIQKAIVLLRSKLGYYPHNPSSYKLSSLFFWDKDLTLLTKKFEEDQAPSICELHWAPCFNGVLDKKFLESTWKESSMSAFEGIPLQRMPKENEFLFLLAHGGKHRWEKLSYLLDLHQFILWANFSQQDWERVIEKAFRFGWSRFCLLGIALSKNYYNSPIPEPVFEILEKSWIKNEEILSVPKSSKRSSSFPLPRYFTLYELFDFKKHKFFFILKSLRFPSSEIVKTYRLPFFLSFLYIPLSAFITIRGWIQRNCSSLREFIRRIK
ncbi:hypothetical protein A7K93_09235 [Candidatus Methylacidiphilum fumarolicum]|uniref:Nucleotidyltransferase family protein n=2 Tax=Candidatus Methylacidiphilum fumarolicum TaxID=591154 RepID=I0JZE6_METFB|nr:nucleotidyltransferase family protein [Candidatus Methylacidiphilum fumarolicum]MBW6415778.1 nucleotidyltransferase family protein [Candidatus Methylacidiphilum fumarolicum]TFE66831.1 hypothetical protein A7K73_09750 [Candidatus Methylacidiphilum fumarolicum]TFE72274.1 hypothetical protein A7K93_09235 [Candidatus Methylacidiphilum fumarolicum]TFE72487.1 hypothetical protein A7K72_08520 [Candidatus Methylacidiphilum fumarolicum]TFE77660.1 hypothetical protein A7D33_03650 [Candidatus Methylac